MNYRELKDRLSLSKTSSEKLSDEMINEMTAYFKSSFAFPFIFSPALLISIYAAFAIHNAMLSSTEDKFEMSFGVITFCLITILLFAFIFISIRNTYLWRHAIKNTDYCVVDGQIDDIDIGRYTTIYTTINSGDNKPVELDFATYHGNEILNAKLETNEWPKVQFVCTDYGVFAFSNIGGHHIMLAEK